MPSETAWASQAARANRSQIADRSQQTDRGEKQPHRSWNTIEHVARPAPRHESIPVTDGRDGKRQRHQRDVGDTSTPGHRLDCRHRGIDEVDDENPADDAANVSLVSSDRNGERSSGTHRYREHHSTFLVQPPALGDDQSDRPRHERDQRTPEMRDETEPEETRRRRDRDLLHQISRNEPRSLRYSG